MVIPWEKSEQAGYYESTSYGRRGRQHCTFLRTVEFLDDSPKQYWRKGDIVKFDDGRKHPWNETWEEWFMTEEDFISTLPWHGLTPKYAANQYAVIAGRYRIVKDKFGTVYKDYGATIMMITGPKKGHMRRYWMTKPFELIESFPYVRPPRVSINLIDTFMKHNEDSNKSRNAFLKCLHEKLNVEEL